MCVCVCVVLVSKQLAIPPVSVNVEFEALIVLQHVNEQIKFPQQHRHAVHRPSLDTNTASFYQSYHSLSSAV